MSSTLPILAIVFAGISLIGEDSFQFLAGAIIYVFLGFYALYHGGIVGRDGRIVLDIAGGYFTVALLTTFFLAGMFLLKFIVALKERPPSTSIRLIKIMAGKTAKALIFSFCNAPTA